MLYRSKDYILAPYEIYECVGDVPNVTFPCATLTDAATGRIAIYYGAPTRDRRHLPRWDTLLNYVKENMPVSSDRSGPARLSRNFLLGGLQCTLLTNEFR